MIVWDFLSGILVFDCLGLFVRYLVLGFWDFLSGIVLFDWDFLCGILVFDCLGLLSGI